jgi:hypothetical protein
MNNHLQFPEEMEIESSHFALLFISKAMTSTIRKLVNTNGLNDALWLIFKL